MDTCNQLKKLKYTNLQLNKEIWETYIGYLDSSIMFDNMEQQFKKSYYWKVLNRYQRVPCASAHTNEMKRAVIWKEATRVASILLEQTICEMSLLQLREEYRRLDYAPHWIDNSVYTNSWSRLWEERHVKCIREDQDPIVFKTILDPMWDYISFPRIMVTACTSIVSNDLICKDNSWERFLELKIFTSKSCLINLGDL